MPRSFQRLRMRGELNKSSRVERSWQQRENAYTRANWLFSVRSRLSASFASAERRRQRAQPSPIKQRSKRARRRAAQKNVNMADVVARCANANAAGKASRATLIVTSVPTIRLVTTELAQIRSAATAARVHNSILVSCGSHICASLRMKSQNIQATIARLSANAPTCLVPTANASNFRPTSFAATAQTLSIAANAALRKSTFARRRRAQTALRASGDLAPSLAIARAALRANAARST